MRITRPSGYGSQPIRATIDGREVIILYGNNNELHETAIRVGNDLKTSLVSFSGTVKQQVLSNNTLVLQYTTSGQQVIQIGSGLLLYILGAPLALKGDDTNLSLTHRSRERVPVLGSSSSFFWNVRTFRHQQPSHCQRWLSSPNRIYFRKHALPFWRSQ